MPGTNEKEDIFWDYKLESILRIIREVKVWYTMCGGRIANIYGWWIKYAFCSFTNCECFYLICVNSAKNALVTFNDDFHWLSRFPLFFFIVKFQGKQILSLLVISFTKKNSKNPKWRFKSLIYVIYCLMRKIYVSYRFRFQLFVCSCICVSGHNIRHKTKLHASVHALIYVKQTIMSSFGTHTNT